MRYLAPVLDQSLRTEARMVFVAGPRQVGKTTLARYLLSQAGCEPLYFNWDIEADRRLLIRDPSEFFAGRVPSTLRPAQRPRIVLDEIHKYPRWKRFLKGLFDAQRDRLAILVTGSGRLDLYQRGGDSLFGRYDLYRLAPFTVGEVLATGKQTVLAPDEWVGKLGSYLPPSGAQEALEHIERFTGFPEPLFAARDQRLRKWRRAHRQLTIREDLRDLTRIRDLGLVESLVALLPERVGSPLSLNALAGDLGVAFNTVRLWMDALSRLYLLFELRPYAGRMARALRREAKVYLFDPTEIPDAGARFENITALHLRKLCDLWTDVGHGDFDLAYVRDKEKREVDFLLLESRKPWLLIEAKLSDPQPASALRSFAARLNPKMGAVQIVRDLPRAPGPREGIRVVPAAHAFAMM
jgi:predicted AAA+ superfamily ATPase